MIAAVIWIEDTLQNLFPHTGAKSLPFRLDLSSPQRCRISEGGVNLELIRVGGLDKGFLLG
jgi:hypothetical protein